MEAKWMTGILKKEMQRGLEGKRYCHEEVCMLLQKTAQVWNIRLLYLDQ
jgi:hypothetical protein